MQGILQESGASVVITDVIETEWRQNDGRTCKNVGGASAGRRLRGGGEGVVCNSEGGNLAYPVGNSSPRPHVPNSMFPYPTPKMTYWNQVPS
nr:MAG TPA_asm: hypothetical protein [Caudoviricetes sp.]